jgi:hypothetical protein
VIHYIDVSSVLRRTVCDLYSNLVTRSTGMAVRREIETALAVLPDPSLTIIDFSHVGLLDFSCADEVVGKLLASIYQGPGRREAYVLVRGARDAHLEAIEAVLERYGLAVTVEDADGRSRVVGALEEQQLKAFELVSARGVVTPADAAVELGEEGERFVRALDGLWDRRLVMRVDDNYLALPRAL